MNLIDPAALSPADLGLMLAQLLETDPNHPLVLAARLALEIGDRRAGTPVYVDDYAGGRYHRQNLLPEYTAVEKHRWPPNGDRDEWIQYGPAGRPTAQAEQGRAA